MKERWGGRVVEAITPEAGTRTLAQWADEIKLTKGLGTYLFSSTVDGQRWLIVQSVGRNNKEDTMPYDFFQYACKWIYLWSTYDRADPGASELAKCHDMVDSLLDKFVAKLKWHAETLGLVFKNPQLTDFVIRKDFSDVALVNWTPTRAQKWKKKTEVPASILDQWRAQIGAQLVQLNTRPREVPLQYACEPLSFFQTLEQSKPKPQVEIDEKAEVDENGNPVEDH